MKLDAKTMAKQNTTADVDADADPNPNPTSSASTSTSRRGGATNAAWKSGVNHHPVNRPPTTVLVCWAILLDLPLLENPSGDRLLYESGHSRTVDSPSVATHHPQSTASLIPITPLHSIPSRGDDDGYSDGNNNKDNSNNNWGNNNPIQSPGPTTSIGPLGLLNGRYSLESTDLRDWSFSFILTLPQNALGVPTTSACSRAFCISHRGPRKPAWRKKHEFS
ncbi:hypothetical protein ACJ72_02768 [Emergomyces africanus]|uniref:Uncharacterized protein n=1 Tax=Emergomyces africanus TaxID=1955775 RepID=A0A1B7P1I8_9EURO|nr:hypothetical protein ACJ72_02768 [Emergomyces africanus]